MNPIIAEIKIYNSDIFKKSNDCLNYSHIKLCKNLILQLEKLQLSEFEKNRFKCQTSILGLQSELVSAYFFDKKNKNKTSIMNSYVSKNC